MRLIIVGCGRLGRLLARKAIGAGHAVTVVDTNAEAIGELGAWYTGQRVVGNGFQREALLDAGVQQADGLAAVTGSDNANVLTCLAGRDMFHVPRVVARIYDPAAAEIYRSAGIPTVNPTSWGATRVSDLIWHGEWHVHAVLGDGDVELVEAEIPHRLVGRAVDQLNVPGEIVIAGVTRAGSAMIPYPGMALAEGDRVHCAVHAPSRSRLRQQLAR
jgi:trk system potassium uptake protein TrkA